MIPHSKPFIDKAAIDNVLTQLDTGMVSRGEVSEQFKEELKTYTKAYSVHLVPSGSAALVLALEAMSVKKGDEIILPTYVCSSVADAIIFMGATPVFCDIGKSWIMTPDTVRDVITSKTRAIVVVHIFGIYADVKGLKQFGIPLIEDCCQSFATEIGGNTVGVNSDIAFYSFHATKCLTTGEGGAVACFNKEYEERLERACTKYFPFFTITDLQSSLGLAQLEMYESMLARRKGIADYYFEVLPSEITAPIREITATVFFRFPLRAGIDFDLIKKQAAQKNVAVRRGVDSLLHLQYKTGSKNEYRVAGKLFDSTISIPIYPALTDIEVETVGAVIKEIFV